MDKVRVYIQSADIPLTQVNPVISGQFQYTREKDRLYYKHESKDSFKFGDRDDWQVLEPLIEKECQEITVTVQILCAANYTQYWQGVFTMFEAEVDEDRCFVEAKPEPIDDYKCFEDGIKEEQNIYTSGTVVTVTAIGGSYEEETCVNIITPADCDDFQQALQIPYDGCLAEPSDWCLKSNTATFNNQDNCDNPTGDDLVRQTTVWQREVLNWPCSGGSPQAPAYGTGWQLLTDNCAGDGTADWWRCPINSAVVGDYDQGRTLENVMVKILANLGCGLTIKSDFFGINVAGDAPSNAAYDYAIANLQNLTVHQKSDIKRKNDPNPSTEPAWVLKAKDWFEDFQKIFNVWFIIEDDVFIWEHYSFFTTSVGMNLTNTPMKLKYNFSGNDNIGSEKYLWADELVSYAFRANTIFYDCGKEEKEQRCTLITTDLDYIESFPDNITDEGFVLIANYDLSGTLVILDNNEPLKWTNLQENLHKHGRLFRSGKLNNVSQDFLSWIPYKKQESFKTDLCCSDEFSPYDLITTKLGNAVVDGATHDIYTNRLEIEPSY